LPHQSHLLVLFAEVNELNIDFSSNVPTILAKETKAHVIRSAFKKLKDHFMRSDILATGWVSAS